MHAGFLRRPPALPMVAVQAARYDVVPGLSSPLDDGNHVVECQVLGAVPLTAILAGIVIPGVDVCPTELHMVETLPHLHIPEQAKDAGHPDREADAPYLTVVFGDDLDLALKEKRQSLLPGDDVYRFVSRIQNEGLFHLLLP